jgi:hypothetical protein
MMFQIWEIRWLSASRCIYPFNLLMFEIFQIPWHDSVLNMLYHGLFVRSVVLIPFWAVYRFSLHLCLHSQQCSD